MEKARHKEVDGLASGHYASVKFNRTPRQPIPVVSECLPSAETFSGDEFGQMFDRALREGFFSLSRNNEVNLWAENPTIVRNV